MGQKVSDENKPVRMAFSVTHQRVQHYDVIKYMVDAEVARCKQEENFTPSQDQIRFFSKELVRYVVIRRDLDGAGKIRIKQSNLLNENTTHSIHTRTC